MHWTRCVTAAALLALFNAGCALERAPAIGLEAISIMDRSADAVRVDIALSLTNDNDDPLQLEEFEYQLALDRFGVYAGRWASLTTLPARETATLHLPAVFTGPDAASLSTSGSAAGEVGYRLSGRVEYIAPGRLAELLFQSGVRRPDAAFSEEGRTTLRPGLISASMSSSSPPPPAASARRSAAR